MARAVAVRREDLLSYVIFNVLGLWVFRIVPSSVELLMGALDHAIKHGALEGPGSGMDPSSPISTLHLGCQVLEAHLKWKSEFGERRTVHIVHGLSELPVTPGAMPHDNVGSRVAPTLRDGIGPESSLGMTREAPSTYGANNQISGAVESSCVEATGIQLEPGGASDKLAVAGSAMQISSAPASGERTDFAVVPGATQTTLDPPCLDDATYNVQVCASAVAPSRFRADGAYGTGAARKAARLPFKSPRQVQPREGSGVVSA